MKLHMKISIGGEYIIFKMDKSMLRAPKKTDKNVKKKSLVKYLFVW